MLTFFHVSRHYNEWNSIEKGYGHGEYVAIVIASFTFHSLQGVIEVLKNSDCLCGLQHELYMKTPLHYFHRDRHAN